MPDVDEPRERAGAEYMPQMAKVSLAGAVPDIVGDVPGHVSSMKSTMAVELSGSGRRGEAKTMF